MKCDEQAKHAPRHVVLTQRFMQEDLERHTRQALEQGLPPQALAILGDQAESARQIHQTMQENLQAKERREQAPIAIHHYLCDHLGTPLALTDQAGHGVWAARLDPWGQVQEEYNPQGIHQEIRLPGQHHDRETGLYYNRHRYYDPEIGAYINQDPIGLRRGWNLSGYSEGSPLNYFDPIGLATKEQVDTAVNVLKGQFPEILKTPKSVTGVAGLSGTLGQALAGRTDLSGNIKYNADLYGEDGVSMCESKLDDFLQTMAHEMQHLNESVFDRIGLSTGQLLNRISPKFSSIEDIIDHNADTMYQSTINKYKSILNDKK